MRGRPSNTLGARESPPKGHCECALEYMCDWVGLQLRQVAVNIDSQSLSGIGGSCCALLSWMQTSAYTLLQTRMLNRYTCVFVKLPLLPFEPYQSLAWSETTLEAAIMCTVVHPQGCPIALIGSTGS